MNDLYQLRMEITTATNIDVPKTPMLFISSFA
jgi:hypothetical protein